MSPKPGRSALVIGGSWFIGKAIVEALLAAGYQVTTLNRGVSAVAYSGPVRRVRADRRERGAFARALAEIEADVLVDVSAYAAAHTRAVVGAFRGRLAMAVHISTASVYRWPAAEPVAEDWPLEDDPENAYGFHKAECERLLASEEPAEFPCAALRLPPVYGPGDPISREHYFYRRLAAGRPVLLPDTGPYLTQNIFVEDVAAAVVSLLATPAAAGRAYNVGGRAFTVEDYVETMGRLLGLETHLAHAAPEVLAAAGIDVNEIPYLFSGGNMVLDGARLAGEIAFRPDVSLEDGLARTFAWLATNPALDRRWEVAYEAEDRVLKEVA